MRGVEPDVTVLMNPADAADHPDGTFGGHPIVPDPGMPEGWARFRVEPPPGVTLKPSQPLTVSADDMRALGIEVADA